MTDAAPIIIPLNEHGAPDLQLLVHQLGVAAVRERGEEYDPRNNPKHGGYQYITPELWAAFDRANAEWQHRRRQGLGPLALRKEHKR